MSDRRYNTHVCGRCARISKRDMERKHCPITLAHIFPNRPADSCGFFVEDEERRGDRRRGRRDDDVFDE